jgi:hypothetical protein
MECKPCSWIATFKNVRIKHPSLYKTSFDIFVRPRKLHDKSESLRLESYLYASPSVQERIMFGVRSCNNSERVMEMEKHLKDVKERVP